MRVEFVFRVRYPDCKLETISLLFTLGLYAVWARALHTGYWWSQLTPMPTSWTQRANSVLARLPSLRFFFLLCFSRLAQENIFLVAVLPRALNSGANGVVYMKCRGRTDWRPWGGGAATSAREGCSHRVEAGLCQKNHNKSDVTRPCGWYE